MSKEARICPEGCHVSGVMRGRGQTRDGSKLLRETLKKNCHKREILGYPPALPPADSDTIYSFSGQSRL